MIGTLLDHYRILETVGEGGMGTVYRALDVDLQREVAIKMMHPELFYRADVVDRFRSEAVALARLNHPNIATLFHLSRKDDRIYMVMEFARGETLESLIRRTGVVSYERAVGMCCQVLLALEYAHSSGVVHRDIKPANLMLTSNGTVKVTDFGIARVLGSRRATNDGHIVGTLTYMSPEQVRGQEVDGRSDLYSLGVVFYELVAGRVPFTSQSDYDLMAAQLNEQPAPPESFSAQVPPWLSHIILKALAKAPADRYQSALEFRQALEKGLRRHRAKVGPPPEDERTAPIVPEPAASRLTWKHAAAAAAVVLAVVLIVTGVGRWRGGRQVVQQPPAATTPAPQAVVSPPSAAVVTAPAPPPAAVAETAPPPPPSPAVDASKPKSDAPVPQRRAPRPTKPAPAPIEVHSAPPLAPPTPAVETPALPPPAELKIEPTPPPPRPAITPQSFGKVKMLDMTADKAREVDVVLRLGAEAVVLVAQDSGKILRSLPYGSVAAAAYSQGKRPPNSTGGGGLGGLFRGTKHWLTLGTGKDAMVLQLDKDNYRMILTAVEKNTAVKIEKTQEER